MAVSQRDVWIFATRAPDSQENWHSHQEMKMGISGFLPRALKDLGSILSLLLVHYRPTFHTVLWCRGTVLESDLADLNWVRS